MTGGDELGRRLAHDNVRAPLVRRAFEMMATGTERQQDVLIAVTAMGLRNRRGKPLTLQSFRSLLRNPIYSGLMVVKKWRIEHEGAFDPIVTPELFQRVQDVLSGSVRRSRRTYGTIRTFHCAISYDAPTAIVRSPRVGRRAARSESIRTTGARTVAVTA